MRTSNREGIQIFHHLCADHINKDYPWQPVTISIEHRGWKIAAVALPLMPAFHLSEYSYIPSTFLLLLLTLPSPFPLLSHPNSSLFFTTQLLHLISLFSLPNSSLPFVFNFLLLISVFIFFLNSPSPNSCSCLYCILPPSSGCLYTTPPPPLVAVSILPPLL